MSIVRFGPAGTADSFKSMGYKKTIEMPLYLEQMGLNAFEYQCGRGVKIKQDSAAAFGKACREKGIQVSLHAPYYISMSSVEPEKREKSVDYVLQSAQAIHAMGASRIIVHTGSCAKISREDALALAKDTMKKCIKALDGNMLQEVHICPETMGRTNQLGTLEEVLELCKLDDRLIPCIDFGHLNARTFGGLRKKGAYQKIFDQMENAIGIDRMRIFHAHFSKIAYTVPGGEKCHLTFADEQYGPEFEPLAEQIAKRRCSPVIICESAGTQAEDAAAMKQLLDNAVKQYGEGTL